MSNGPGEKFCLRWNDFENNISSAFRELRDDKDFFDVTLACEDNQLQAHKVILSACSPFFRTVLKRNPHPHPLLYLKGVKYESVLAVLNFMYHGEVNVAQEELNSFLSVAEDLKVKGLTQNSSEQTPRPGPTSPQVIKRPAENSVVAESSPRPAKQAKIRPPPQYEPQIEAREVQEVNYPSNPLPGIKTEVPILVDCDVEEQGGQLVGTEEEEHYQGEEGYDFGTQGYGEMQGYEGQQHLGDTSTGESEFDEYVSRNIVKLGGLTKNIQCLICNKVALHIGNMKQHFDVHHFHRSFSCDVCGKVYDRKNSLDVHKRNKGHNSNQFRVQNSLTQQEHKY